MTEHIHKGEWCLACVDHGRAAAGDGGLREVVRLAAEREHAEEVLADATTAYNESQDPTVTRKFLQLDRLETERAEAVHRLRAALAHTESATDGSGDR